LIFSKFVWIKPLIYIFLTKNKKNLNEQKEKDFFIDIKIDKLPSALQPSSPSVQAPIIQSQDQQLPLASPQQPKAAAPFNQNAEEKQTYEPSPLSPIQNEDNLGENEIIKSPKQNRDDQKISAREKHPPPPVMQPPVQQVDIGVIIESGHESLMKALRNRFKNIQFIRSMWANGNIRVI